MNSQYKRPLRLSWAECRDQCFSIMFAQGNGNKSVNVNSSVSVENFSAAVNTLGVDV